MDFKKASLAELKEYVKKNGIKNVSTLKKGELALYLENLSKEKADEGHDTKASDAKKAVKPETKAEVRQGVKPETRSDVRQGVKPETKSDIRQAVKPETKSDARQGVKPEQKSEQRQIVKPEMKNDSRYENKPESKQENVQPHTGILKYYDGQEYNEELDSGQSANGILEVMADGYGFIRSANYLPGDRDIYVSPVQIRRFGLKKGDIIGGPIRLKTQGEKFGALLYIKHVNGFLPSEAAKRVPFEELTPIFPNERISLDENGAPVAIRIVDLLSPIGKGQRGMIVSPPKAGKTTLLKAIAKSISIHNKDIHMIVLLIDERPEEVTDIRESIEGENVEVIYSTFDELPDHHKRVSEMVIERAKRLVEHKKDVVILLDSITRLARAYNLTVPPSGRTLSGGLDPAALHMPKRFFGAARNMREGGSLTILATALVETGSRMDDVVFEEFKGTGNMEVVLDRKLSEKRIFPAIDIAKSSTRRDDLLLSTEELEAVNGLRKAMSGIKSEETIEEILKLFVRTRNNQEFVDLVKKSLLRR